MTATIFDVKHFAVHDGPGIRTTLFFKGCPLKCIWCHNPEGIARKSTLYYNADKCVSCAKCASVCETHTHVFDTGHRVLRENCIFCGKCEKICAKGALSLYAREISLEEALSELLEDRDFYSDTGGVTLSGGECLMQADFCEKLLASLKKEGINTAVDTSGFVSRDAIDKVLPYTDLFLYDIKAYSPETHKACTGATNEKIIENLFYLDSRGAKIEIRIPLVPEYNLDEIKPISELLCKLKGITGVRILPYHNYASGKYKSLGMENTLPERLPCAEEIKKAKDTLSSFGLAVLD